MIKIILILLVIKVILAAITVYYFPRILLWVIKKILFKMGKVEQDGDYMEIRYKKEKVKIKLK
jgi:hypothetical protein